MTYTLAFPRENARVTQNTMTDGIRIGRVLLHASAISIFSSAFYTLFASPSPFHASFGSFFQFLTIWGLAISLITSIVAFVDEIRHSQHKENNSESLNIVHDLLAVAVPMEFFVTFSYWSMISYDPKLLAPPGVKPIPLLLDLSIHFFPFLLLFTEFLCYAHYFTRSTRHQVVVVGFSLSYAVWMHICYEMNGYWAYPMLGWMTEWQRIGFIVASAGLALGMYEMVVSMHHAWTCRIPVMKTERNSGKKEE